MSGEVLLVPGMDRIAASMAAAVFRSIGYDARVLDEDDETLGVGLQHTDGGECAPCPSTVGAAICAIRRGGLDPNRVVFFMPTTCGPCRFGQYAQLARMVFDRLGWKGLRLLSPSAENAYAGLTARTRIRLWRGMVVSDLLRRMLLRVRPYEAKPGSTDREADLALARILAVVEADRWEQVPALLADACRRLRGVPARAQSRPLVGVVGEIYVRFNTFLNGDICRRIEQLGGEAALATMGEWVLYTNHIQRLAAREGGAGPGGWISRLRLALESRHVFERWERAYAGCAAPLLADRPEPSVSEVLDEGRRFLPWQVRGEAILTLGRARLFVLREGARAVVNVSPAFCMPGTLSTSIFPRIEQELGVPVVCLFFDGIGDPGRALVPVMHYLAERRLEPVPAAVSLP